MMVHHVSAECAARVGETIGKACGLRVEQQPDRLDRRCTEEDEPRGEFDFLHRLRIDHANAARAASLGVIQYFRDDTVWPKGEAARFARRRERGAEAVE